MLESAGNNFLHSIDDLEDDICEAKVKDSSRR